jgi:hypothetical protein
VCGKCLFFAQAKVDVVAPSSQSDTAANSTELTANPHATTDPWLEVQRCGTHILTGIYGFVYLRYSGASLGYQLSSVIAGGPSPLIAAWLLGSYHSDMAIAVFILALRDRDAFGDGRPDRPHEQRAGGLIAAALPRARGRHADHAYAVVDGDIGAERLREPLHLFEYLARNLR